MAKENETVADIIAKMRSDANADEYTPDGILGQKLNYIADRLEAAHKRERGNAAKLREAVSALIPVANHGLSARTHSLNCTVGAANIEAAHALVEQAKEAITGAHAALAAPPRNCDMGTEEEQAQRFYNFCTEHSSAIQGMCDYKCPCIDSGDKCHCLCKWMQMPYEEGGGK